MFKQNLLKKIARNEGVPAGLLRKGLLSGQIVIPLNLKKRIAQPVAIGKGLRVKINTNIGTSTDKAKISEEIKKLGVATQYGSDTIMDLSTGGNLRKIRQEIIKHSRTAIGTVPVYEAAKIAEQKKGSFEKMTIKDLLEVIQAQAAEGVDFFTIHAGILKRSIALLKRKKRVGGIVSRGGALMARWMHINKKENPFYEHFDEILNILKRYNIVMSLGDALRPGAIADSTDALQLQELRVLSQLVTRCRRKGVQVMVEGPGHIRLDEVKKNVLLQKRLCDNAPFYVLGPLSTDIACGYDHIVSAIGGALASLHGADYLCVVTPAEHLRHPSCDDIREGVIAAKIAAHSVDILRFKKEWRKDYMLSRYRAQRNWEKLFTFALDKTKAKTYRASIKTASRDVCSMCGTFCSLKIMDSCSLL